MSTDATKPAFHAAVGGAATLIAMTLAALIDDCSREDLCAPSGCADPEAVVKAYQDCMAVKQPSGVGPFTSDCRRWAVQVACTPPAPKKESP